MVGLDLLRGLAAFSVAIPHFMIAIGVLPETFESISVLGVEIFFVLSGYVLAPQILLITQKRLVGRNIVIFWIRRWMRTIPPYAIALAAISITSHRMWSADFTRYLFYMQNLFSQANTDDYFSIAWSLSVEEWFYLTFPLFLGGLAFGRRDEKSAALAAVAFIAIITIARTALGDFADWGPTVRRVVAFRVDSIAYGFLLYLAVPHIRLMHRLNVAIVGLGFVALAVGGVYLTEAITPRHSIAAHSFPFYAALFGSTGILFALKLEAPISRSAMLTWLALFLGRISYSVYLFHLLVLTALTSAAPHASIAVLLPIYVLGIIAVGSLMYAAVEAPVLAQRPKLG
jgi:peptidoglycan/LPS O-acetylase OafA/YrhL